MAESWLLYYITDRKAFADDEPTRRRRLLEKIAEAARANLDYIQLREKDLSTRELESLARESVAIIQKLRSENRELRVPLRLCFSGVKIMYYELHARSAFSFLEGASLPETLVSTAAALGMPGMALLDGDGVYGAPRLRRAAFSHGRPKGRVKSLRRRGDHMQ